MNNIEKYREFCKLEKDIPIFSKDWWLDSVCGEDNWNVILIEKGGSIVASMPYYFVKKKGLSKIIMPKLTQTIGPYIKYPKGQKYATRISYEKEVLGKIIEQLPPFDYFSQSFFHKITNWLPFYWNGYKQTTRYTYILSTEEGEEAIYKSFASNIRTDIKKAKLKVSVSESESMEMFYEINTKTFKRKKMKTPYSLGFVKNIDKVCKSKGCRKILLAIDSENNIHAGIYLIWDDNTVYYLLGGGDPKYRNSGATSLLLWEGIKFAIKMSRNFDFEGSMIEPVEKFVRAFGAKQQPYFQIEKTNSKLLKTIRFAKELLK